MADGKLNIKGTITIKTGKTTKRKRKPRKKKSGTGDTSGYTGTGKADTRQEFGTPYTAQALMQAMSLRPQIMYAQEQFKTTEIQQPTLTYGKFEELPQLGYDEPVVTTRREFEQKAVPFLEASIQQGIKQKKELLEADLREAEQDADYAKEALRQKQQFYEDGMEQAQANFQKQLSDMKLGFEREKAQGQLSLIGEKAKTKQEMKQLKEKSQQEIEEQKKIARVESIRELETTKLEQAIGRIDRTYTFTPEEGKTKRDILRDKLIELEGLNPIAEKMGVKVPLKRGRPPKQQVRQPSANEEYIQQLKQKASQETQLNEKLLKQLQEEQLNEDWLQFSTKKQQLEQRLETFPKESSLSRTLPNYVKTPYGMMTEERAKKEFGTMNPIRLQQAEALDLAGTVQGKKKFGYMV